MRNGGRLENLHPHYAKNMNKTRLCQYSNKGDNCLMSHYYKCNNRIIYTVKCNKKNEPLNSAQKGQGNLHPRDTVYARS